MGITRWWETATNQEGWKGDGRRLKLSMNYTAYDDDDDNDYNDFQKKWMEIN